MGWSFRHLYVQWKTLSTQMDKMYVWWSFCITNMKTLITCGTQYLFGSGPCLPSFKHVRPTKRIHTVWYNIAHVSPCRCVVSVCEETHNNLTHNSCECLDLEHDMYTKCFLLTLKWLNVLTTILVLLFVPQILRLNKWAKNTWINPCCKNVLTRNGLCYLIKPKKWR